MFKIDLTSSPRFWIVVTVLLAIMGTAEVCSVLDESATYDEGFYIAAGYSHFKTGDFRMVPEHPPLARLLNALPLLWLRPELPLAHPSWARGNLLDFAGVFLYHNRIPADTLLFTARSVTIVFTLLFGLVLVLWTRQQFGAAVALLALLLYAFDPNLIAHGRYTTNDFFTALFFFLAVITWGRYLVTRRAWDLAAAGVTLGLALLTKFSAVLLLPIYLALYLWRAWQEEGWESRTRLSVERFFASALVVALIVVMLIFATYGFKTHLGEAVGSPSVLADVIDTGTPGGHFLTTLTRALHLPNHPYLMGLFMQFRHNSSGHPSYLLGQLSDQGWWYYYPVVFLVKTPTAVLVLTLLGLLAGVLSLRRLSLARLRDLPFAWVVLAVPLVLYSTLVLASRIDLGVRYILPLYPFLLVLVAALVFRFRRLAPHLVAVLVAVQVIESAANYPNYLAFFNTLSGGPSNGSRYLLDSNLDWGQDLKKLKRYLDANHVQKIPMCYFGTTSPAYYGIADQYLPRTKDVAERQRLNSLVAISATVLHDLYLEPGSFAWLRARQPVAKAGQSIYIYDLRTSAPDKAGRFRSEPVL
jgi:4-amino-4-deoxy-L-arabinose transferase-like glycosyltransferase